MLESLCHEAIQEPRRDAMISLRHLDHLGDALRQLRQAARQTQKDICGRTGLLTPQLSRWENGHEVPTLESLVKYLGAIGASLADLERTLLGEEDEVAKAAVTEELRQIRAGHAQRIASSSDLRLAVKEIMQANAEGLEQRIQFLEERIGGHEGERPEDEPRQDEPQQDEPRDGDG